MEVNDPHQFMISPGWFGALTLRFPHNSTSHPMALMSFNATSTASIGSTCSINPGYSDEVKRPAYLVGYRMDKIRLLVGKIVSNVCILEICKVLLSLWIVLLVVCFQDSFVNCGNGVSNGDNDGKSRTSTKDFKPFLRSGMALFLLFFV